MLLTAAGTPRNSMYQLVYAEDAFASRTSTYDAEYFSYCQDPSPFKVTLVTGRILICNFVEYYAGGAAAQFQAALSTAEKLKAVGLLILTEASDAGHQKGNSFDPIPFSLPATFVTDNDAAQVIEPNKPTFPVGRLLKTSLFCPCILLHTFQFIKWRLIFSYLFR
jgi:hypothetical protein